MWMAIGVGAVFLAFALLAAYVPLVRSMLFHSWEHQRARARSDAGRRVRRRAGCPLCDAEFHASTAGETVLEKNRHVLLVHARTRDAADAEVPTGS